MKSLHVIPNARSADTRVALNVHEVTDGDNDFLNLLSKLTSRRQDQRLTSLDVGVQLLQNGDGKSCSLSCS